MLPLSILKKISPIKILYPYHHVVSDERLPHIANLYSYKNIRDFTRDLDCLLKYYKPIQPEILAEIVRADKPITDNTFLMTFDDGFREVADIIAPILYQKGVPSIFFINPAFINNNKLFYRCKISLLLEKIRNDHNLQKEVARKVGMMGISSIESLSTVLLQFTHNNTELLDTISNYAEVDEEHFLKTHMPYLTEEQVLSLSKQGFSFGGHSWDHPYYKLLTGEEHIEQTLNSCKYVKSLLNQSHSFFSFPHEDAPVQQSFFEIINSQTDIDLFFGTQNQKVELRNRVLHRFNAERPWLNMKQLINGVLIYSASANVMNQNTIVRR